MKRKILVAFIFLLILLPLSSSQTLRSKLLESPLKNIAYSREYSDGIVNSAAFNFRTDDINFYISEEVSENYSLLPFNNDEPFSFLQKFSLGTTISFGSDNLMLSGNLNSGLDNKNIKDGTPYYDFNTYNNLQLDTSFRYKFFALGFRMEGGNITQRAQRGVNSFNDIFANMIFEKFVSVPGSEYFSTGLSSFFKFNDFSATLMVEELIKVLDTGTVGTSWKQILESLSVGFSYESPRYKADGNLHFARFRAGLSFEYFLSPTQAVNALTCDVDFQLLPDISIIIGTGLRNMQRLDMLFRSPSLDSTYQAIELKLKLLRGSFSLNVHYPLSVYKGWNDNRIKFSIVSSLYF